MLCLFFFFIIIITKLQKGCLGLKREERKKEEEEKKSWLDIYAYITTRRGAQREMKIRRDGLEEKEEKRKKNPLGSPSVVSNTFDENISWGKQKNFKKIILRKNSTHIYTHTTHEFLFILNLFF